MSDPIVEADQFIDVARRSAAPEDMPPDVAAALAQALLMRSIAADLRQMMNSVGQIAARR
jgi:hypothetical protein